MLPDDADQTSLWRVIGRDRSFVEVFHYWVVKSDDRSMPYQADIKQLDMLGFLENVMLIDVVPDERRFVYRLVGSNNIQEFGFDPTSQSVLEQHFDANIAETLDAYDWVAAHRRPLSRKARFLQPSGKIAERNTLYLPLSADNGRVSQILIFTHHEIMTGSS